jgi:hypothetical protein
VKTRLAPFVAAVTTASAALDKAGKKTTNAHVVSYLSVIASLVEGLRGCFDFTAPASPRLDPKQGGRLSWTEMMADIGTPPPLVDVPLLPLASITNGDTLQDHLFACEDALGIALQLCDDDPALFEKHQEVEQSASLPRPRPKAHTLGGAGATIVPGSGPDRHATDWERPANTSDALSTSARSDTSVDFPPGASPVRASDAVATKQALHDGPNSRGEARGRNRPKTIVELLNADEGPRRASEFDDDA